MNPEKFKEQKLENLEDKFDSRWKKSEEAKKTAEIERERSREQIIEKIFEEGGLRVDTSLEKELSPNNTAGMQSLESKLHDNRKPADAISNIENQLLTQEDELKHRRLRDIMFNREIHEIVSIQPEKTPVYEKGKFAGFFVPKLHSEIVENGKEESAVRIVYFAQDEEWHDYSGRRGQQLIVEIVLSKSTAEEIEKILDLHPVVIREVVGQLMKEKFLKDPKAWEIPRKHGDPLRPPYEKWDSEAGPLGSKIYIQKESAEPGWHKEFVKRVR